MCRSIKTLFHFEPPATDEEILSAYHLVARSEGVFVEPASAASIAGLLKSVEDGWVKKGSTGVCTVTGNGLKDPQTALEQAGGVLACDAEIGALEHAVLG